LLSTIPQPRVRLSFKHKSHFRSSNWLWSHGIVSYKRYQTGQRGRRGGERLLEAKTRKDIPSRKQEPPATSRLSAVACEPATRSTSRGSRFSLLP